MTEDLLSTGLFTLDKELDGGLYPGTLYPARYIGISKSGLYGNGRDFPVSISSADQSFPGI